MKTLNSFFVKISVVFLASIVALAALQVRIVFALVERQRDEVDQRANVMLAADMALEIEPYLQSGNAEAEIGSAIHFMMVLNPLIEIYLLGPDGTIRAFFADSAPAVATDRVDLEPVRHFLEGTSPFPIYGDDPRRPDRPSTFSVADLVNDAGYLYVILGSSLYETARSEIEDAYVRAALRRGVLVTLPFVAIVGLVAFFLLTVRLQRLTTVVRAFGSGSFDARAPTGSRDEVGTLARSFNTMADTIEANDTERRDLVANISHDIRTPLAAIRGYTETLLEKGAAVGPEERRRYLETTLGSIDAVSSLVDDLFELSRLEAPDHSLTVEEFSLAELCQDVVMQLSSLAGQKGVTLVLAEPDNLVHVHGDIKMIERVLSNLIDNAIRYAPQGTAVDVQIDRVPGFAGVSVGDGGPGIAPEHLHRVFDRFYTGDPSRSARRSGLGLAIARRIVELHGGSISVESEPAVRTVFSFKLPM